MKPPKTVFIDNSMDKTNNMIADITAQYLLNIIRECSGDHTIEIESGSSLWISWKNQSIVWNMHNHPEVWMTAIHRNHYEPLNFLDHDVIVGIIKRRVDNIKNYSNNPTDANWRML